MLDKKDIKTIKRILDDALLDFFENLIKPYFEHNEKAHNEIVKRHDEHDADFDKIFRKLERNEDQHDQIFQDQDKYEKTIKDHERRIKRVEIAITATAT